MRGPLLHGLDPKFSLDEAKCKRYKIDLFLKDLPAEDWSVIPKLVEAFTFVHSNNKHAKEAKKIISQSFDTLSKKERKHLSLYSYCIDIVKYLKSPDIKQTFISTYDQSMNRISLEKESEAIGIENAITQSIIGGLKYKNKLDETLENMKDNSKSIAITSAKIVNVTKDNSLGKV